VYLALTQVAAHDPDAIVVIYPSDHFVYPESAFLDAMENAVRCVQRDPEYPLLLGVQPSGPEPDYGWIVPSVGEQDGARRVEAFLEKPSKCIAEEALAKGGLWNTLIIASRLDAIWSLGCEYLPEIMGAFERLREALEAGVGDAVLEEIYGSLPARDFSSDALQRSSDRLTVLEMNDVWWSDWGRPERILETLRALGHSIAKGARTHTTSFSSFEGVENGMEGKIALG
jgi:mannose-1-phosphate guanylyltransferase